MCKKRRLDLQACRERIKRSALTFDVMKEIAKDSPEVVARLAETQEKIDRMLPSEDAQVQKADAEIAKAVAKLRKRVEKDSARRKYKKTERMLRQIEIAAVERGSLNRAIEPCDEKDFVVENGVLVKYVGSGGRVVLPTHVETVGSKAFEGCDSVSELIVSGALKSIEDNAFAHCKALSYVCLPDTLVSIGDSAFYNCLSLSAVSFEEGLTNIAHYAFAKCPALSALRIPDSVTRIGEKAFFLDKKINRKAKKRIKKRNPKALG